ncbi:hypothetical protein [Baekduia sp.]|jgi:hypothetical protein|uniref:hypothetical protein n=1 Tax=Baekduia sp. TaxID=2600305 RepID=UPI002E02716D|nr:hypothetical protein [Baekduia sp.]
MDAAYHLFEDSNFDAYDRGRYPAVLRSGLEHHRLELSDVLAVTQDFASGRSAGPASSERTCAVCSKRIEVDDLIPYSSVASVHEQRSGPHSRKLVLIGQGGGKVAQIDFSPAGPTRTIEQADACRTSVLGALRSAMQA